MPDKKLSLSSLEELLADPAWLAHRYDMRRDSFVFRYVPREVHRTVTFITDDYLPADAPERIERRDSCIAANPPATAVHFIFHSAYCCSTLLARAFDIPGQSMGLKEPVLLNDLIGWRRRGGSNEAVMRALDHGLRLLARPFSEGESIVVKPSNVVNSFAGAILALRPDAKALFLHAPLDAYLRSLAKKGLWGRLWGRELLYGQLQDGLIDLGLSKEDLFKLSDLQAAAVTWLAQHVLFSRLIERFGSRIRVLTNDTLLADPSRTMQQLLCHFSLELDEGALAHVLSGPAFTSHSKTGDLFSAADRAQEHSDAQHVHAEEIGMVMEWAKAVARSAGHGMLLPNQLIEQEKA